MYSRRRNQELPERVKNFPLWHLVLPYLTFGDLENFARSHYDFRRLTNKYREQGYPLVIDRGSLKRFSIAENRDLYASYYGFHTRNLVVEQLSGSDAQQVLECFPNITELTFRETLVCQIEKTDLIPRSLKKLSLIGNKRIAITNLPNLTKLTLIKQRICGRLASLSSLRELSIDLTHLQDSLEEVLTDIGSLGLEKLNVVGGVSWNLKGAIEDLRVPEIRVRYFHKPEREANAILRLNDDELLYVQDYLGPEDAVAFSLAHSRIPQPRSFNRPQVSYTIEKYDIRYPIESNEEFYRRMARLVTHLKVKHLDKNQLEGLLSHFSNLLQLDLTVSYIPLPSALGHLPSGRLSELKLHWTKVDAHYDLRDFFRRIGPTLTVLLLEHEDRLNERDTQIEGLSELRSVESFTCSRVTPNKDLVRFMGANRGLLEISLTIKKPLHCPDLFIAISQLQSLRVLVLDIPNLEFLPRIEGGSLPMLEYLKVTFYNHHLFEELLEQLDGSRITGVQFSTSREDEADTCLYTSSLLRLKKLRRLFLDWLDYNKVVLLLHGLPDLEEIFCLYTPCNREQLAGILAYLVVTDRELMLNKRKLSARRADNGMYDIEI